VKVWEIINTFAMKFVNLRFKEKSLLYIIIHIYNNHKICYIMLVGN